MKSKHLPWTLGALLFIGGILGAGGMFSMAVVFFRPDTPWHHGIAVGCMIAGAMFISVRHALYWYSEEQAHVHERQIQRALEASQVRYAHNVLGVVTVKPDYDGPSYPTRELAEKWGAEPLEGTYKS